MSTFSRGRYGYAPGYDGYEEEPDEPIHAMHPDIRRKAARIARCEALWTLRQWWLSGVAVLTLIFSGVAALSITTGLIVWGALAWLLAGTGTLYLLNLALRPR